MIGYDGCVRLLDFGVARASERLEVTRTGVIKGRLAYMAPEQMHGLDVDHRADLWSVGVLLWEGLTGRSLFRRESEAQTIMAVTREALPPATHPTRIVPASLQAVVARALERQPARRFATAREFGIELQRCISSHPQASMSDVSEWMRSLFVNAIAQKRVLLRESAHAASAAKSVANVGVATQAEEEDDDAPTCIALPIGLRRVPSGPAPAASHAPRDVQGPVEHQTPPHAIRSSLAGFSRRVRGVLLTAAVMMIVGAPYNKCSAPTAAELMAATGNIARHVAVGSVALARAPVASTEVAAPADQPSEGATVARDEPTVALDERKVVREAEPRRVAKLGRPRMVRKFARHFAAAPARARPRQRDAAPSPGSNEPTAGRVAPALGERNTDRW